jgi:hypothetical protein
VPCPECKQLEVVHGKLGDLVSRSVPPWLPDGMAELLDDVIGEVSEYIQSCHHLVVVEGFHCSWAEKKNTLEHVNCGRADPGLEEADSSCGSSSSLSFSLVLSWTVSSSESTPLSHQAC